MGGKDTICVGAHHAYSVMPRSNTVWLWTYSSRSGRPRARTHTRRPPLRRCVSLFMHSQMRY